MVHDKIEAARLKGECKMTILIMEDDLTMIEILKSRISWRRMGVDKIMTATSTPDVFGHQYATK